MMSTLDRFVQPSSRSRHRFRFRFRRQVTAAFAMLVSIAGVSADAQTIVVARSGSRTTRPGPAESFTGRVQIESLFDARDPSHVSGGSVTFEPGARTAWHVHPRGQTLIVTAGTGRVQRWGDAVQEIRVGDVVRIPPGQKHWHGASPQAAMTHIAITEHRDGALAEWMEQVSEEQYNAPVPPPPSSPSTTSSPSTAPSPSTPPPSTPPARPASPAPSERPAGQPSASGRPSGLLQPKVAPGLAVLTDDVLFGDVWNRPELAPRDRSLVTVSALIATGKSAQLAGHLGRALTNGVTPTEASGLLAHLAIYAGWPNAVSALEIYDQVYTARKIDTTTLRPLAPRAAVPASDAARAQAVVTDFGTVAPKFAQLTNDVVFADLWRRPDLTPRDRSLVTIAALAAMGDDHQLDAYLRRGLESGLTRAQIVEALTHLAFYAGWPKATSAIAAVTKSLAQ